MPLNKSRALLGILIFFMLILIFSLVFSYRNRTPIIIDETFDNTHIYIEAPTNQVALLGNCFHVGWNTEHIAEIYLNGQGTVGNRDLELCRPTADFRIVLPDETEVNYVIRPTVWIQKQAVQIQILALMISIVLVLALLGFMGTPHQWRNDWLNTRQMLSDFVRLIKSSSREHLLLLLLVLILGSGLRIFATTQEFTIDEAASFNDYTFTFVEATAQYNDPNDHLLNTLFLHILRYTVGINDFGLRLHVLTAGIALIFLTYSAGLLYYNRTTGLIAAAFVAGFPVLVQYSATARGYGLQATFFMLLILFIYILSRRDNHVIWTAFVVTVALSFFTLPTTVYIYTGIGIWLFLSLLSSNNRLARFFTLMSYTILASFLTLLLYAPTLIRMGLRPIIANSYIQRKSGFGFFQRNFLSSLQQTFADWTSGWFAVLAIVFLLLVLVGLLLEWRMRRHQRWHLLPVLLIAALGFLLFQQTVPYPRVWTFFAPLFCIQAAVTVAWFIQLTERTVPWISSVFVLAIMIIALGSTTKSYIKIVFTERWRPIVAYVEDNFTSPDRFRIILYNPAGEILEYYFKQHDIALSYLNSRERGLDLEAYYIILTSGQTFESVIPDDLVLPIDEFQYLEFLSKGDVKVYRYDFP